MSSDAVPSPVVTLAMTICELADVDPQNLTGYVVVYVVGGDQLAVMSSGFDTANLVDVLCDGVKYIHSCPEPDLRIRPPD